MSETLQAKLNESLSWIAGQRWFGDKERDLLAVEVHHAMPVAIDHITVEIAIVQCRFADGGTSDYFLPISGVESGDIRDGFTESAFRAWFYEGFLRERTVESDAGIWRWSRLGSMATLASVRSDQSTLLRREQSNSSIIFDDRLIAKVFRKLEPGMNPDVEIGAMFADSGAKVATPAMVGALSFETGGEVTILQQFVHNVGDGWGWLLDQLRHRHGGIDQAIALLGQRTGEMHLALAHASTSPEFVPERFSNADLVEWQARLGVEVGQTFEGLRTRKIEADKQLAELEASLLGRATNLDPLLGSLRIRIHGDYHLGQVLRTVENDFAIIDFEGEPSRPMAQRREKWPALRDVAGMIRSFDYAVETISRERGGDADMAIWRDEATNVFVTGYRTAVGQPDGLYPEDLAAFNWALSAVIIEKALYEARYEMSNRPDWLPIPFEALRRLATYH
ncbi:MAG: hypothetical protein WKF81_00665 [Thermomicrobiales bacterium]